MDIDQKALDEHDAETVHEHVGAVAEEEDEL